MRTRSLEGLASTQLEPLLEEESLHWLRHLSWDYREVATAVLGGLERGSVTGRAFEEDGRIVAYGYSLADGHRGVIGSLFCTERLRGQGIEECLLDGILAESQSDPARRRIECQTLFCTAEPIDVRFLRAGFVSRPRRYMVRDDTQPVPEPAAQPRLRAVRRDDLASVAELIWRSHSGSLDALLNSTYATPLSCRAFVETLVLRNGCGHFDPEASRIAESGGGKLLGALLASRLSPENGHVCQVSVAPEAQGRGLGGALLSFAISSFRSAGLKLSSLSVTLGNERAHDLYLRYGFVVRRAFAAHAWARPPARIELLA